MSRYIDADKLCKNLTEMARYQEPYKQSTILGVVSTIENTPTANVVEVVRCKDCKFFEYGDYCSEGKMEHSRCRETDYCSYGERNIK